MKKIIFIDRDGVLNKDPAEALCVNSIKDLHILKPALKALKILNEKKYRVYVISNQSGVGRGTLTKEALVKITTKIKQTVILNGGRIDGFYYCTHKPDDRCECRKPKTGLIEKVLKNYKGDKKGIFFIGDRLSDVQTGHSAGLSAIVVLSGHTKSVDEMKEWEEKPEHVAKNLLEAVKNIVLKNETRYYVDGTGLKTGKDCI